MKQNSVIGRKFRNNCKIEEGSHSNTFLVDLAVAVNNSIDTNKQIDSNTFFHNQFVPSFNLLSVKNVYGY